jgi:hypothetical protein
VVRLEASNIPAFQTEDFMPPENEMKSRVDFVYSEDQFERDSAVFWKKTGKSLNDQLERFVGKRKAMEQAVAQIVRPPILRTLNCEDLRPGAAVAQHLLRSQQDGAGAGREGEEPGQRRRGMEARLRGRGTAHLALSRTGSGGGFEAYGCG